MKSLSAPIAPAAEDLVSRRPVWEALSELFLDTDRSLLRISRVEVLARSPYSVEQLELILSRRSGYSTAPVRDSGYNRSTGFIARARLACTVR